MDPIQGLDYGTYYWFRNLRLNGPINLEPAMLLLNELGNYPLLGILALAVLLLVVNRGGNRAGIAFVGSVALAHLTVAVVNSLVGRPRPVEADMDGLFSSSFPSSSAFLSSLVLAVFALTLANRCPQGWQRYSLYLGCLLLVLAIGASQLFLGYHFLTDILAGWAGGFSLALAGDLPGSYSFPRHGLAPGAIHEQGGK